MMSGMTSSMSYGAASAQNADELLRNLATSWHGLSAHEAAERLRTSGPNLLASRQLLGWNIFVRQFRSPFVYLLIGAAALSFALREFIDGAMVVFFVLLNALLGWYQEYHSEKTVKLLQRYVRPRARVRRAGQDLVVEGTTLVPGDIVLLEPGDVIPADLRLLGANALQVDESVLTGESVPVKKTVMPLASPAKQYFQAENIGFSGTRVVSGGGEAVVITTGPQTAMGSIAKLTVEAKRESSFEKGLSGFSRFILRLIMGTLVFVFLVNLLIKGPNANFAEFLIFAVALAVGVTPEALPVVTTFSLSRGALRLARNKVVVKRLSSIEDLGSIEVLCTDKTGTLTENVLTVSEILGEEHRTLWYGALGASLAKTRELNNAFDIAIMNRLTPEDRRLASVTQQVDECPFDPVRRRNSVLIRSAQGTELVVRGAAEVIIPLCTRVTDARQMQDWIAQQGQQGRRVIAVARRVLRADHGADLAALERDLECVGLIAFHDPLKPTAALAVRQAKALGVQIKILTGDSREVAGSVAHAIGLTPHPGSVLTGDDFDQLSPGAQAQAVKENDVFARVSPQQKYAIIQLLKQQYEVGFLGEGINDAPALKSANVGMVVDGASDISREAADIVLLQRSLKVIVEGIREGRSVFANTTKYIKSTLASNFGNFYAVAVASMLVDFLPMLPLQILLVNLLSDFPMIAVATDTVDEAELHTPRHYDVRSIALLATILGVVSTVFDFIFFALFRSVPVVLQTNWFIGSILTELVFIFSVRTPSFFLHARRPSRPLLWLTVTAALITVGLPFTGIGQSLFHFRPPTGPALGVILGLVLCYFIATEVVKLLYYRYFGHPLPNKRAAV